MFAKHCTPTQQPSGLKRIGTATKTSDKGFCNKSTSSWGDGTGCIHVTASPDY